MKLYFHLERCNWLEEGDIVKKEPYRGESVFPALMPYADTDFLRRLDKISRKGLSLHGARYLIKPGQGVKGIDLIEFALELQFEYARYIYYKERPSRLQSLYAFDSYERTLQFKKASGNKGTIYEVDFSGLCFIGDMNWLKAETNSETQKHYAMSYWEGKAFSTDKNYDPQWECVIDLPVTIVRKITD